MALKLTTIQYRVENAFVEIQTETGKQNVEFSYKGYTPAISRAAEDAVEAAIAEKIATNVTIETLARVLVSWGVLDEDDKPLPITRENLLQVPFEILNQMIRVILESANPKKNS